MLDLLPWDGFSVPSESMTLPTAVFVQLPPLCLLSGKLHPLYFPPPPRPGTGAILSANVVPDSPGRLELALPSRKSCSEQRGLGSIVGRGKWQSPGVGWGRVISGKGLQGH